MVQPDPPPAEDTLALLDVANFLGWCDPQQVQGGVTAEEAFDSFCKLMGLPKGRLLNIVRGKPDADAQL